MEQQTTDSASDVKIPPVKRPRGRPRKERPAPAPIPQVAGISAEARVEEISLVSIDFEDTEFEFRVDPKIKDLIDDIGKNGQQFPVILRAIGESGMFQIVSGFRRCRAVKALGWPSVKAIVRSDLDDDAAYRLSFLENDKHKGLTPLDKAHAVCRLRLKGKTDEEIRDLYGMAQRTLERSAQLANIPEVLKDAVRQGRILSSHCLVLLKAHTTREGGLDLDKWINKIEADGLSVRQLNRVLLRIGKRRKKLKRLADIHEGRSVRFYSLLIDFDIISDEDRRSYLKQLREVVLTVEMSLLT